MSLTLRKNTTKFARLHLVIVDLWRPWKINQTQVRSLTGALRRLQYSADCTTPLSPKPGKTPLHGRRFVFGYSLDGSDFPCYLLWPKRMPTGSFCLLESQTQRYVDIEHAGFLHPLGLRHFSGTSMMDSACELRSVFVYLHLRLFNYRRRKCPLIWCCHVQL